MKKILLIGVLFALVVSSCTTSYTTVATPQPNRKMIVTSGDFPQKDYTVLGFIESSATTIGLGLPTEGKISKMKTSALNDGLVRKAEGLEADAIINVRLTSASKSTYIFFLSTDIFVSGTAIKFNK